MKRLALAAGFVLATVLAFNVGRQQSEPTDIVASSAAGEVVGGSVPSDRDIAIWEARIRRIRTTDSYLPHMLTNSDSTLRRWVGRERRPLLVYFEPADVRGYTVEKGRAVRDAFARWRRVGELPVTFRFVDRRDGADVVVRWISSFSFPRAGQADLVWQSDGNLRRGTLTLATHSQDRYPFSTDAIFTVALHEIGHLLGLGHSDDPRDVMYPSTSVHDLTHRDKTTALLLYTMPPGSLKSPN